MAYSVTVVREFQQEANLYFVVEHPGAFVRGRSAAEALAKLDGEVRSYLRWTGGTCPSGVCPVQAEVVQEYRSARCVADGETEVLLDTERQAMSQEAFERGKALLLASARDLQAMFDAIPNKNISNRPPRQTFYGPVPRTAQEMYDHVNEMTAALLSKLGLETDNVGQLYYNRMQAVSELEDIFQQVNGAVLTDASGELWTLGKVLRRFLWHDRIHGRAMYRMAAALWGKIIVPNPFFFL